MLVTLSDRHHLDGSVVIGSLVIVYTKIWKRMLQRLEISQDHATKESIACRSEPADSDAKTGISFLQIVPTDNNEGYDRRQDKAC